MMPLIGFILIFFVRIYAGFMMFFGTLFIDGGDIRDGGCRQM